MNRLAVGCALLAAPGFAVPPELGNQLRKIEERYNHAQSLKLDFSETYAGKGHPAQNEAGVLYLKKPGRMRWEYTDPPGKLFLSDGKAVYLYTPEDRKAEKGKLKESDDMRAPLAFLLGKLDFAREFKDFELRAEGTDTWIVARPKSANLAYNKVEFLAQPSGEIRRVRITGQDQSLLSFTFSGEQLNAAVAPSLFAFTAPAGVQIVETEH
ncbi:MAG: outer membrane lipoprotein chaperone LolA [Terriglobia bacterium]